jgi:hypothetical protein
VRQRRLKSGELRLFGEKKARMKLKVGLVIHSNMRFKKPKFKQTQGKNYLFCLSDHVLCKRA